MGSDLLVKTADVGDFPEWFRLVSAFFVNFLAIDTQVGLKDAGVEKAYTIPSSTYVQVRENIEAALIEVAHAVSNKSPLPFAFPKVIVDLMAHQLFSPVADSRGVVKIDPVLPAITPIDDDGMKVVKALFGVDGYYASSRGLVILESAGYLGVGGEYLRPTYITAKSKPFRGDAQSLAPSTKVTKFSTSQKIIRITSAKNVTSVKADGNVVDDLTGLAYLFPSLHLDAASVAQVAGRLVQSVHPCEDEPQGIEITAARFVQWFYSCDQRGGPALRGFLILQPNFGINFDMQRSVLQALEIHNKRKVTSVLPDAPNASLLIKQLSGCLIQYNPTTVKINDDDSWNALNNLANINKDLLVTLPVAETLRAHKCGMLPFSTSTSRYTGLTQTMLDHYFELPKDTGDLKLSVTDCNPFDLGYVDFDFESYENQTFSDSVELYTALRANTTRCRDFLVAFGGELQLSPALSYDLNRQPISPAYAIGKIHKNSDRATGNPLPFGLHDDSFRVSQEQLLSYVARFDDLPTAMGFLPPIQYGAMPDPGQLDSLHEGAVEAMVSYEELTLAAFNLTTTKTNKPDVLADIPLANHYLESLSFALADVFNIAKGENKFMEILTKIDDKEAVRAAFLFTDMLYYPIVYDFANVTAFDSSEQRLILLGYHGTQTLTINKYHSVSTSSQVVDGKFATLAGDFLSKVGKAGGFGLGEILGPVINGLTPALGSIIGGDAANIVGGVLGAATSFLPFF